MNQLLFLFPFGYFLKTRLNTLSAWLFHGYAEYLLGFLLLLYSGLSPIEAFKNFVPGYLAFISIYEIGYIFNDFVSVRFEKNPRKRLSSWNPSSALIMLWVLIRVAFFLAISYYLGVSDNRQWLLFYLSLVIVFALHNSLNKKGYKIFTFVSLAFIRFYAPVFLFLSTGMLLQTLAGVFIHYILFRTITYIDSKDLLRIPDRNSLSFKTAFYALFIPLSGLISILSINWLCLWINLYFLVFWGALLLANKMGLVAMGDIKTD
jgi:hypothetical protein